MNLKDELRKYGFTIAVGLVVAAIVILGIKFIPRSVDVEAAWQGLQPRAQEMQSHPDRFLPEDSRKMADDHARKARNNNKELTAEIIAREAPFEDFFPEAWQAGAAWKQKGVPSSQQELDVFMNEFQKVCGDRCDAMAGELAGRLKPGVFTQMRTDLRDRLDPQKLRSAATLADKLELVRDVQKAYWIVEAIGRIVSADKTGNLPLRLDSIEYLPRRVKEGNDSGLIYSRQSRGAAKTDYVPYGAFEVKISVLIDQRDIPSFLYAMRSGAALEHAASGPASLPGSSAVVLDVLKFESSRIEEKEIVQYYRDDKTAEAFAEKGIVPRTPPIARERETDTETGLVHSSWVSKILRGELEIKPENEVRAREIREYLNEIRYPGRLEVSFIVPDYKPGK